RAAESRFLRERRKYLNNFKTHSRSGNRLSVRQTREDPLLESVSWKRSVRFSRSGIKSLWRGPEIIDEMMEIAANAIGRIDTPRRLFRSSQFHREVADFYF